MKKYLAEFLGTFVLALAVGLSLAGTFPIPTPVVAALTLMVCVYTLGAISGAHFNPAISIGLLAIRKINLRTAIEYVIAQFAGAGLAKFVTTVYIAMPAPEVRDTIPTFAAEALGTFWLAVGVCSVVLGKAPGPAAGLTIGGSLLMAITLALPGSNGVLNPAVALGIGSLSVAYIVSPLVGAVAAMFAYSFIARDDEKTAP